MGRWEPGAGNRLRVAAMELYVEQGFDQTTVAEIADRAGVTARTFFRYFTDKREVLFGGSAELEQRLVQALEAAPADATPIGAITAALDSAADSLGDHRDYARQRHLVIAATPELQERELIKMASLATALAAALRRRGVPDPGAGLAAEAGVAVFRVAFERWVTAPANTPLREVMRDTLGELTALTALG